ncbi:MAG: hypothetical protein M0017_05885 [Desulfobacteraceae bacterium]|nr:hypothetical protein [Desulfobacteraceae bacterium]
MDRQLSGWACVLLLGGLIMWPAVVAAADCTTAECHQGMAGQKVHPGDMDCESCHKAPAGTHPGGGKVGIDGMCTSCHTIAEKVAHPHAPVAAGDCTVCHDPHRDTPNLLRASEAELCLSCHAGITGPDTAERHGPIREGACSPCHQAHGSDNSGLLTQPFPDELFVGYDDKAYALCFSCHDRNLLRFPDTSFATGFRDGERNLHYLHVNKTKRGRSCRLCHMAHASAQPKLMAETVNFGNWALPLNFRKTETGGSCAPGCHREASYDRNSGAKVEPK